MEEKLKALVESLHMGPFEDIKDKPPEYFRGMGNKISEIVELMQDRLKEYGVEIEITTSEEIIKDE